LGVWPARRVVVAVGLAIALCLGVVGGALAEPVRFVDPSGDQFVVDPSTGQFSFSSPRLPTVIAGQSRVVQVGRRFSLVQKTAEYELYVSVDMSHLVVSATVVRAKDRRLVLSMRNATTTIPATPTATPTPQPDAWRVAGNGSLASNKNRQFAIDVFRNAGDGVRGTFTYKDPAQRLALSARRIDSLVIDAGGAQMSGVYTQEGRGDGQFTLQFRPQTDGTTLMSLALAGGYRADDMVAGGRVRITSRKQADPSPTPTTTPTRLPAYTPTTTPTPLPTSTPPPTMTPTPPLPTVPPQQFPLR